MKKRVLSLVLALTMALCLGLTTTALAWEPLRTWSNSQMIALMPVPTPSTRVIPPENAEQAAFWRFTTTLSWEGTKSIEETLEEIKTLTQSLTKDKRSETEKARAIFDWVTSNIAYGTPGKERLNHQDGLSTFYFRKGECNGYAKLSNLMLAYAGLTAAHIEGNPQAGVDMGHAWSAVYADGNWLLFDSTWGEWDISPDFHYYIAAISIPFGPVMVEMHNYNGEIAASLMEGYDCPSHLIFPDGITAIDGFNYCDELTTVTFPDSLTTIGKTSFLYCTNLTSITFPSSLTTIEQGAFTHTGLTKVTLPKGFTNLEERVFYGCDLTEIQIEPGNPVYTSVDGVVFTRSMDTLVCCPNGKKGVYIVPDGTTIIEDSAFWGCDGLTDIVLPDGITTLGSILDNSGSWVFNGNVTIPATVTSISFPRYRTFNIYYKGSKEQWQTVMTDESLYEYWNVHYNSVSPTANLQVSSVEPSTPTEPGTAYASTQTVMVDGQPVTFNAYALKDEKGNLTNYVKLRDVAQTLNGSAAQFEVGYDGTISITTNKSYTSNGSEMVKNFDGDQSYTVNTSPVKVDGQAADLETITLSDSTGGYTYFKLRDLGKALGFDVSWVDGKIVIDPNSPYSDTQ